MPQMISNVQHFPRSVVLLKQTKETEHAYDENILSRFRKLVSRFPDQHVRLVRSHFLGVPPNEIRDRHGVDGRNLYRDCRRFRILPRLSRRPLSEKESDA